MIKKVSIPPGIDRESTQESSGPAWYDGNNVRWRDKYTQTIGGWVPDGDYELEGIGRGLHSWTDFSGNLYQCVGTTFKYYIITGTNKVDITPRRGPVNGPIGSVVTTTIGSAKVKITDAGHGASVDDFVVFQTVASDINSIPTTDFTNSQEGFQIYEIVDDNKFMVDLGGTVAGSSGTPAVDVTWHYKIKSGTAAAVTGTGWGVGPWGGDDFTPTEYDLVNGPVDTNNGSKVINVSTLGSSPSQAIVAGDSIYIYGLTGDAGGVDFTYLNNKWWPVDAIASEIVDFNVVEAAGDITTTTGGGGNDGKFYHYDATGSISSVDGASRGWGDASTDSVQIGSLRTLSIANFGEDLMFANRGGPIYYYDVSSKTSSGVPSDTGYAVELKDFTGALNTPSIVDGFVVSESHGHTIAFGCNDIGNTSTQNRMLIRWSDRHNPFNWLPSASTEAGGEVLRHGSSIVGAIPTRDEILIFTDAALYSMRYVGYPNVYGVSLVSSSISICSRMSAIPVDNSVFFMCDGRFYVYNGSVRPLPKNVTNFVFDNLNESQKEKIFSGVNSKFTEVYWFYPDGDSFEPNRYVSFNYSSGAWGIGSMDMLSMDISAGSSEAYNRTAWQDHSVFEDPMATYIVSYDPQTEPQTQKTGLMRHETGSDAQGSSIDYSIESGYIDIDDGGQTTFYDKLIPDIQVFNVKGDTRALITASIQGRDLPGRSAGTSSSVTVDFSDNDVSGLNYTPNFNDTTIRGRARAVSIKISSMGSGFGWRLGETRIRFRPDGEAD